MEKSGPLERVRLANQIQRFRIPDSCETYAVRMTSTTYFYLLHRQERFPGKYTTCKVHTKPGLEWHIFHILTTEDFDDFTDIKFDS